MPRTPRADGPADRPADHPSDRAAERASDRAAERASDRASDRPSDNSSDRASDNASDRSSDRPDGRLQANGLRAVLFDWDGTLVDSAAASYRSYVRVFSEYGIEYDRLTFERTYTPDWYRTYEAVGLPKEHWPRADARWTEVYEEEPSALLPGARAALERFAAVGLLQGLVSSGDAVRVRRELGTHGLGAFFGEAVVCGGETERRKPDPQPLLVALERMRVRPEEAAYVGDSPEDVRMALAAGVLAVGVPGGFPNRDALAAAAPDVLAPSLEAAVDRLLAPLPPT